MRTLPLLFLLFLPLLCGNSSAFYEKSEATTRQGKDYALFFAVETYDHMGNLNNPIDNATAIAKELKDNYSFQTEVVPNPTFADIAAKIQEYQQRFASGAFDQKGQLLVFFSGHGVQRGNNGYFIPKDGDPTKLYQNVIEYDYWRNEIDQVACQHILVTIDACYSLTFDPNWRNKTDRNFGRRGDKNKDQVKLDHDAYRARLFFTSDGTNNQTPDRSTLARQFLAGLRTYRSANNYLPADELYASFLKRAAPVPGGGDFGRDEPGSRFLFFRKSAPVPVNARADIAAWNQAKASNTCAAYRAYLQQFPSGDFAGLAQQQVTACAAEEKMLAAWADIRTEGMVHDYEEFVRNYPRSPYVEAANLRITQFRENQRMLLSVGNTKQKATPPDNMVFIPGGTFQMGDQFGDGRDREKPVHAVTLSDFYLSRTELTFAEYDRFCAATGRDLPNDRDWGRDQRPAIYVSWLDAIAYCNWWSEQSRYTPVYTISGDRVTANWSANGYRLPTEAEWEYAARSGGKKQRFGNGQDVIRPLEANFDASTSYKESYSETGTYRKQTVPVSSFSANGLGLADMSGNVWEWCWDWYDSDYYGKSPSSNPRGPDTGTYRVIRGGGWSDNPSNCRTANRGSSVPTYGYYDVGFRLARSY